MNKKLVIIINGKGGAGKDTLINSLRPFYGFKNISSITPIKELAEHAGWTGEKDEKSRKLLSDLKKTFTDYNDLSLNYLLGEYEAFLTTNDKLMFVQIREPEEIDRFKKMINTPCVTLLIVRDGYNKEFGNSSDDNCEHYRYDYIFHNCYEEEVSKQKFDGLVKLMIDHTYEELDKAKKSISHEVLPLAEKEKEIIPIVYHTDAIEKLDYIDGKSDWIDLRAAQDVELHAGDFKLISLGVSMKIPDGYEAHIVPRSSTFKNYGILQANSMGVIDQSYCGPNDIWRFPAYATRDTVVHVNDRICQFRIVKNQPKIEFNETKDLGGEDRGGFGSTGQA